MQKTQNNNKTTLQCLTPNDTTILFKIICRWGRLFSPRRQSALFLWFEGNGSHWLMKLNKRGKTVFPVSLRLLYSAQLRWQKKGLRWDFTRHYAKNPHCRSNSHLNASLTFTVLDRWNAPNSLCRSSDVGRWSKKTVVVSMVTENTFCSDSN